MSRLRENGLVCSRHERGPARIIQMYVDGTKPVLFIGEDIHSESLEGILDMLGIDYEMGRIPNGKQGPALEGKEYKVVGMGYAEVRGDKISVNTYDRSSGYGIGINHEHFEKVRPFLNGFELEIV